MIITKANLKDLKEIVEIAAASIKSHRKYNPVLYDPDKALDFYKKCLKKSIQKDIFIVAEAKERVVGYVYGDVKQWYPGYNIGSVIDIAVKGEHQGKGIGKLLLNKIINSFREKGCKEVILQVNVQNERAIGLYKSFGFEPWKYELKKKL